MSSPTAGQTNLGGPDSTTATEFMNDLLNATSSIWMDQLNRWSGIVQQFREGSYTFSRFQMDLARMWEPWIKLAAFPVQWATSGATPLATILLIVDQAAETVGPAEASTNITLPPGITLQMSELHQVGGDKTLNKKHAKLELSSEGNRVSVKLVELGNGPTERQQRGVQPGLYIGAVYAKEVATPRPLAVVYVLVEPTEDQ